MQTGVMREREREKKGSRGYPIKCIFKRVLDIFLRCIQQLISNLLPCEECACTRLAQITQTSSRLLGCQGTGRGRLAGDRRACLEKHQAQEIQFFFFFFFYGAALRTRDSAKRRRRRNGRRTKARTNEVDISRQDMWGAGCAGLLIDANGGNGSQVAKITTLWQGFSSKLKSCCTKTLNPSLKVHYATFL